MTQGQNEKKPATRTTRTRKAPAVKAAAPAKAAATKAAPAKTTTRKRTVKPKADEPTLAQAMTGEVEVKFQRDGNDVVLTVGGKKRSLDEVDEGQFNEAKVAVLEK